MKKVSRWFGVYAVKQYFCTRFRERNADELKYWTKLGNLSLPLQKKLFEKKLRKSFGSSKIVLTFASAFAKKASFLCSHCSENCKNIILTLSSCVIYSRTKSIFNLLSYWRFLFVTYINISNLVLLACSYLNLSKNSSLWLSFRKRMQR